MTNQKEYHIKTYSVSRFLTSMLIINTSLLILMTEYLPKVNNEIITALQIIAIIIISFKISNRIGSAKVKVIFTNEAIYHIWVRRYFLSWERDIKIPWDIVDNYLFEEERTFDSFTINLTNKTRYKIYRPIILTIKDDFKKLVSEFPILSNEYRSINSSDSDVIKIEEGESFYASKHFKWLFYFLSLGFLILLLTKIFDPNSEISWSAIGIIGSGIFFYATMITGQKKNNK